MQGFGRVVVAAALAAGAAGASAQDLDGQQIFNQKCAMCHGKTGTPPPFYANKVKTIGNAEWQKARSDEQIRKAIEDGVKGTLMASFKEAFAPEELDALVKHIRSLRPAAK